MGKLDETEGDGEDEDEKEEEMSGSSGEPKQAAQVSNPMFLRSKTKFENSKNPALGFSFGNKKKKMMEQSNTSK